MFCEMWSLVALQEFPNFLKEPATSTFRTEEGYSCTHKMYKKSSSETSVNC